MMDKKHQGLKEKKKAAQWRIIVAVVLSLVLLFFGCYLLAVIVIAVFFVANEVFFADHIFYNPTSDYCYEFTSGERFSPVWLNDSSDAGQVIDLSELAEEYDTAFLAVRVESHLPGRFFDPFVTLTSKDLQQKQFFERSVNGLRYINISEFLATKERLGITTKGCLINKDNSEVIAFNNRSLKDKKVMIIAPHADDAEIAAFGLYSSSNSVIVTITAGEADPRDFQHYYKDSKKAAVLKGRLRAWDSISVPIWAGVKQSATVQLGYFCLCLKDMHDAPNKVIASKTAGINDTRVFREFNTRSLASDAHGTSTWNTLLEDLSEMIEVEKPDIIVTPHTELDPHPDHFYSTQAVHQALQKTAHQPLDIYYYANHLFYSDMFPFGPAHTLASIPPNVENNVNVKSVVSIPLTIEQQNNKAAALAMMHDLKTPLRWKKKLRFKLQSWLIGRPESVYGEDEYFRKAVRSNELFFCAPCKNMSKESHSLEEKIDGAS